MIPIWPKFDCITRRTIESVTKDATSFYFNEPKILREVKLVTYFRKPDEQGIWYLNNCTVTSQVPENNKTDLEGAFREAMIMAWNKMALVCKISHIDTDEFNNPRFIIDADQRDEETRLREDYLGMKSV